MTSLPYKKYQAYPALNYKERTWPDKEITQAPIWCSVDLRDGNQALIQPMSVDEKVRLFKLLVSMGFKEIEVGFPSAADVEYQFLRRLIDENLIPDDVSVQVLTQAREALIRRTFEALEGCKRAVLHLYNSTSVLQRRVTFKKNRDEIKKIAVEGAELVHSLAEEMSGKGTEIVYEYSPESFTGTEVDYALEVCEAVMDVFQPTKENPMILNLPATVEHYGPHRYADAIEWFSNTVKNRESVKISLHTHNDRGTGIAASELGLLAGADRVEGTLFGNGERTGNVDIVTMALNLMMHGVDPKLDISRINEIVEVAEAVTKLPVHQRHPYAGELVYTAFSGSHQDAINKGMHAYNESQSDLWEVPYLPIDPKDVGRTYESIIRINSQSGKGGVAWILESENGLDLPKAMHPEVGKMIQHLSDTSGKELSSKEIYDCFEKDYFLNDSPYKLISWKVVSDSEESDEGLTKIKATVIHLGEEKSTHGLGNGPIDAFAHALKEGYGVSFKLTEFSQHALGKGSEAIAITYIQIEKENGARYFGAGRDANISRSSALALLSALNRAYDT